MKRKIRVVGFLVVAFACTVCRGGGAGDLTIQSFDGTGKLSFGELPDATSYRVEWAPSPNGPWKDFSNGVSTLYNMPVTGTGSITCSVPMCYRVIANLMPATPTSFTIADGVTTTMVRSVTLDLTLTGRPVYYLASENADFAGASWQAWTPTPTFALSTGDGVKTVYLKLRNAANEESSTVSDTIAYVAPVPPSIVTSPRNVTNCVGSDVSFNVTATGTAPLAYQWQYSGTNMPGATLTNLLLNNIQTNNAGDYRVIVTNCAGAVTSVVAVLFISSSGTGGDTVTNYDAGGGVYYRVHTYKTVGTSTFQAPTRLASPNVEVLVVGGGGGGASTLGGGGGGGGVVSNSNYATTPGQIISLRVGSGGGNLANGSSSTFGTITANGGSAGLPGNCGNGGLAGSGGFSIGLGVPGGLGGGGGAGAGANGGNSTTGNFSGNAGSGGSGVISTITGAAAFYGGGGGGGTTGYNGPHGTGYGGAGGGGNGANTWYYWSRTGDAGTPNTGGGGGGGGDNGLIGGSGGSGVVVVRYAIPSLNFGLQ